MSLLYLAAIIALIILAVNHNRSDTWLEKAQKKSKTRFDYLNASITDEVKREIEWDEEKAVWIDLDKKRRMERYQQFRKEAGKEPTFEEWKAAREKEKADSAPKQ